MLIQTSTALTLVFKAETLKHPRLLPVLSHKPFISEDNNTEEFLGECGGCNKHYECRAFAVGV